MRSPLTLMRVLLTIFLTFLPVFARAGGAGPGGGNSASDKVFAIKRLFKSDNGKTVAETLLNIARVFHMFQFEGKTASQIKKLTEQGLNDDIRAYTVVENKVLPNTYDLSSTPCIDEHGRERSMTTEQIDLSKNPNQARPSICVNLLKLADDNATEAEIMGTLIHEHARHFGVEDTINDVENPIIALIAHSTNYIDLLRAGGELESQNIDMLSSTVALTSDKDKLISPSFRLNPRILD